jgi:hypothetical protein
MISGLLLIMKPTLWIGGALLFLITSAAIYWLPRQQAWTVLASIAVTAGKMITGG